MRLGEGVTFVEIKCDLCKQQPMSEQLCINLVWRGVCKTCSTKQKEQQNEKQQNN